MKIKEWEKTIDDAFLDLDKTDILEFRKLNDLYNEYSTEVQYAIFIFFSKYFKDDEIDLLDLRKKLTKEEKREYKGKKKYPTKMDLLMYDVEQKTSGIDEKIKAVFYIYLIQAIKSNYNGKISDKEVNRLIAAKFEGYDYSKGIEGNLINLKNDIYNSIVKEIKTGTTARQTAQIIKKRFSISNSRINNLLGTYAALMVTQTFKKMYGEAGFKYYRNIVTVDNRTSDICMKIYRDNIVYKFDEYEIGVTAPPYHYYCRTRIGPARR